MLLYCSFRRIMVRNLFSYFSHLKKKKLVKKNSKNVCSIGFKARSKPGFTPELSAFYFIEKLWSQWGDPVMKPPLFSAFKKFTIWKKSQDINNCNRRHKIKTKRWQLWGTLDHLHLREHLSEDWACDKYNWAKGNGAKGILKRERNTSKCKNQACWRNKFFNVARDKVREMGL